MPDFAYTARDFSGNRTTGTISAVSEKDAAAQLAAKQLYPIEIGPDTNAAAPLSWWTGISGSLLATTYSQLAGLLKNGVPLLRSLAVIRDQTSNVALKQILDDIYSRVEEGTSLADAMDRYKDTFGEMAVNMVRAGGEGGFLEDALARVAKFTEEQDDLRSRTMSALAYPVFLAVVGSLVVTALLIFVVPNFEEMFQRLREKNELPWLTDALLAFSHFLKRWGIVMVIAFALAIWRLNVFLDTAEGRRISDIAKLKTPLVGGIYEGLAVASFCRVLGTLLGNGVTILKSLDISRQACGNVVLNEAIAAASQNISAGQKLATPLKNSGWFPADVVEMIAVAEEANTLDSVLVQIADGLERRTSRALDLFVRLLEPIMLLILAVVVLLVVIALLLPVMKMSQTL